ncbi:hypothetical protein WG66_013811 [Moniliophthora roreri]|nr:hypothetical protein WG66_013811 [Moniliophthora roreri]
MLSSSQGFSSYWSSRFESALVSQNASSSCSTSCRSIRQLKRASCLGPRLWLCPMTTTHRVMLRDGEFDGSDFGGEGGHWMSRVEPTRTTRIERLAGLRGSTGYIHDMCMSNHVSHQISKAPILICNLGLPTEEPLIRRSHVRKLRGQGLREDFGAGFTTSRMDLDATILTSYYVSGNETTMNKRERAHTIP